ncbi:hypothetical protein [Spirosoma terrae]|uniref:Uncharacterized protein n=1 Tax=Spirosoma terrae TaxID=1968276 RepID=A0A6L9L3X9_9BACT|nr:hypothetical protein [Spirosoma terrae]NDU95226.1 hypothetical protein [Spirosoma terrae]
MADEISGGSVTPTVSLLIRRFTTKVRGIGRIIGAYSGMSTNCKDT